MQSRGTAIWAGSFLFLVGAYISFKYFMFIRFTEMIAGLSPSHEPLDLFVPYVALILSVIATIMGLWMIFFWRRGRARQTDGLHNPAEGSH
jgi:uncharacterized membrane protein (DUF4010 family)